MFKQLKSIWEWFGAFPQSAFNVRPQRIVVNYTGYYAAKILLGMECDKNGRPDGKIKAWQKANHLSITVTPAIRVCQTAIWQVWEINRLHIEWPLIKVTNATSAYNINERRGTNEHTQSQRRDEEQKENNNITHTMCCVSTNIFLFFRDATAFINKRFQKISREK